jgi:hypothetical protein
MGTVGVEEAVRSYNWRSRPSRLGEFPGGQNITLEFGINRRDVAVQGDHLPAELNRFAGSLDLAIEMSQYATARGKRP